MRSALARLWAAPLTAVGLLWTAFACVTGGRARWRDGAMEAHGGAVRMLLRFALIGGPAEALTLGHVVLAVDAAAHERWRRHERVHVAQAECWGALFPVAYLLASLAARRRGGHPYRDNPFELAAFAAEPATAREALR